MNENLSLDVYNFQKAIHRSLQNLNTYVKIKKSSNDAKASTEDTLDLVNLKLNLGLSHKDMNEILGCFNGIIHRNGVTKELPLPNKSETMQQQFSRNIVGLSSSCTNNNQNPGPLFLMMEFHYKLPERFFPALQDASTRGIGYNICQIIAEYLLHIDPQQFARKPDIQWTNDNQRIFQDYSTGLHFQSLCKAITALNKNGTPIAIGISLDETHVYSGSRTFTPMYMSIMNCYNKAFHWQLLGFVPSKLPYSDAIITKELNTSKTRCSQLLKYALRQQKLAFISDMLSPLLATQENGIKLRVGPFDNLNGYEIEAYIHVVAISCDNKESDDLAGTSMFSSTMKCRMCEEHNCNNLYTSIKDIPVFRKDEDMQAMAIHLEDYCYSTHDIKTGKMLKKQKTEAKDSRLMDAKKYGIHMSGLGYNPLIQHFQFQNNLGINSFFKSLSPDSLHTFGGGFVTYVITWSVLCVYAIAEHDSKIDRRYCHNMDFLDAQIKSFPIIQSLSLFGERYVRFSDGVSCLFKKSWQSKSQKGTGFFANGSLQTYKLPQLLLQLLFGINERVLPFNQKWSQRNKKLEENWNPGLVIQNAMCSVLLVYFMGKRRTMSSTDIDEFAMLIRNAQANLHLLYAMKQDLTMSLKRLKVGSESTSTILANNINKNFGGEKPHLMNHVAQYKSFLAVDSTYTDTELTERCHKVIVKPLFENNSKRNYTAVCEMLSNHRIQVHIGNAKQFFNSSEEIKISNDSIYIAHDVSVKIVYGSGYQELIYENKQVVSKTNTTTAFNQKLISWETFISILDSDTQCESFAACWQRFQNKQLTLRLLCLVKMSSAAMNNNEDIVSFNIHCRGKDSNGFKSRKRNVCDFVEVAYTTDDDATQTALAHVVAIFCFNGTTFFSMVCWMRQIPTKSKQYINFPAYKYDDTKKKLYFAIVPLEDIVSPAFVVPYSNDNDHCWGDVETMSYQKLQSMTYYSIPKENVARNYCYNINDDNSSVNKQSMKEISTSNKGSSSSSSGSSSSNEVDHSNDIFDAPMLLNENLIKRVSNFIETIGKKSLKSQDDKESKRDDDDDESGSFESQDDNESERGDDDSLDCSDDDI